MCGICSPVDGLVNGVLEQMLPVLPVVKELVGPCDLHRAIALYRRVGQQYVQRSGNL